jgi:hypothetical protein
MGPTGSGSSADQTGGAMIVSAAKAANRPIQRLPSLLVILFLHLLFKANLHTSPPASGDSGQVINTRCPTSQNTASMRTKHATGRKLPRQKCS